MNPIVLRYIELALRKEIAKKRPDYIKETVQEIVNASLYSGKDIFVSQEVLLRAIELAAEDSRNKSAETLILP